MKNFILGACLFTLGYLPGSGQVPLPEHEVTTAEQQLEVITESNEDEVTEDDSHHQMLNQLQKTPENINHADYNFLTDLRLLTPIQIQSFLDYRSLMGKFIHIYELQAVPGWDIATIRKVCLFFFVSGEQNLLYNIRQRLRNGDNSILVRVSQVLEKSKGFLSDSSSGQNYYLGSPQRLFVRYKYNYKNLLQYGILGEKDAGEELFKGSQKRGFDFYSAHFFLKNAGIVKSLAVGDFTVNMGQGLIHWMSLAFRKGPDIMSVKRQSSVLRPYNSGGEILFHRGAGITIGKNNWEATVFASERNVDANLGSDTSSRESFITALQVSGLHRTIPELKDKAIQGQLAIGGNFSYQLRRLHLGVNGVFFKLNHPLKKASEPYNLYALAGRRFGNYSADYSYTFKNFHFFGEAAITGTKHPASLNGLMISMARNVDMSFLYRNISRGYHALYANAFTESTAPNNEKGFFTGITVRPFSTWRIDAYADMYRFPWLKFRVNNLSEGREYMLQVGYKPNKQFEIYSRFRSEAKAFNYTGGTQTLNPVMEQSRQNWRTQFSYKLNPDFTLRARTELTWYNKKSPSAETGYLLHTDILYKPLMKRFSGNVRLQYFETDGYNSRIYAYENDVLYSYSIPVLYDKGYRYYINLNLDFGRKMSLWMKFSQYIYIDKAKIGSGLDEILGSNRTEIKLQGMYKF